MFLTCIYIPTISSAVYIPWVWFGFLFYWSLGGLFDRLAWLWKVSHCISVAIVPNLFHHTFIY